MSQFLDHSISRRVFLGAGTAALGLSSLRAQESSEARLSSRRWALLDEVERRACLYFFEQANPKNGLVADRCRVQGKENRQVASIAATGFGLSALAIASERGYISRPEARHRAERTLDFLARTATNENGFFYHFVDMQTGARVWQSEVSSIDTAWLLCGVLHARSFFHTPVIRAAADHILNRVDWTWMWNGGPTLSHGWTPEKSFLPWRWDCYSELLAMYLLAIGSMSNPIPATSWDAWRRPSRDVAGLLYIESPAPLFIHQYSHAWFNFKNRQDGYADYFENSCEATAEHRRTCMSLADKFPWYGPDMWGVTASDSRTGYVAWGAPGQPKIDGTLVPSAAGGSMVFLPDECSTVLETMMEVYGKKVWGQYGFIDAFHPDAKWYSPDYIGIDLGITLLMTENLRSGTVWRHVMASPEAARGFEAIGFVTGAA